MRARRSIRCRKGAPLVEILYPEWAGAQEEYLLLRRNASPETQPLAAAARQRLRLLGMSEAEIAAVERDGKTHARVTLASPISGVIAELGVREGMTVMPGNDAVSPRGSFHGVGERRSAGGAGGLVAAGQSGAGDASRPIRKRFSRDAWAQSCRR